MNGTPERHNYPADLQDRRDYPGMVRWFSPLVLVKTARKAIDSALFGQYADRRLIHAALDQVTDEDVKSRCDFSGVFKRDAEGTTWIDYVSDLGDGFDSTYAIAYLLGQKTLTVEGVNDALPRGHALIMGGDQVYPDATREDYEKRMKRPYQFAFPDSEEEGATHPPLFLIPGNHDWYDGLVLFLAMFCRGRENKIGSWRAGAQQHRSYFALALPDNWWIWGFDSQLGEDIDEPQRNYFVSIAACMGESPKIIICAAVPTWLRAELSTKDESERKKLYRGLNYMALDIASKHCNDPRICAVLSGDMHHYSRYSAKPVTKGDSSKVAPSCQFITAGGGGAFLHPTHQLKKSFTMGWMGRTHELSLKTEPGVEHKPAPKSSACYPDRLTSRLLLFRNLFFPLANFSFCLALGAVYWLVAMLLTVWRDDVMLQPSADGWQWSERIFWSVLGSPMLWFVFPVLVVALWASADARTKPGRWALGTAQAIAHITTILALVSLLPPANAWVLAHTSIGSFVPGWFLPGTLGFFFLFAIEMILIGGLAGGFVWGIYLLLTCITVGIHDNEAFSAMRLGLYRHFLRLRIRGDELTIYPISIDHPPARSGWQWNEARKKGDQNQPEVIPKEPLKPRLIEGPIMIHTPKPRKKGVQ